MRKPDMKALRQMASSLRARIQVMKAARTHGARAGADRLELQLLEESADDLDEEIAAREARVY